MRSNDSSEMDKVELPSAVYVDARILQAFTLTSDTLKSNQDLDSRGVESNDTFEEVTMRANRSLCNIQPHHSTRAIKYGVWEIALDFATGIWPAVSFPETVGI